jgi:hypothetical protein
MRLAKEFSSGQVEVEQFATCFDEDWEIVPDFFKRAGTLHEAVGEQHFKQKRKLPLFREMLDNLYAASDADRFIQTNADIGLTPHFYLLIKKLIDDGNDSFCINKRIVPEILNKVEDIPVIWSTIGELHAGHDCFVFRRELYPKFEIGEICMGTPWSETTLITNMVAYSNSFFVFKQAFATFHIGDRRMWLPHDYNDYRIHNTTEFARVLRKLSKDKPEILDHPTIRHLLGKLKNEVTGYHKETYSEDCWHFVNNNK